MLVPRLPDWLIYATVVAALLICARGRREHEDAPPAPPPPPGLAEAPIPPGAAFAADRLWPVSADAARRGGTAFSVGEHGLWLTAGVAIEGCDRVGVVVAEGRSIAARIAARQGGLALLTTAGGTPALPLGAPASLAVGEQLYQPGFPRGRAGEVAARLLARGAAPMAPMALAEDGRTDGLKGALTGLFGAPVLDGAGQVVGVTLAASPRRGRLYAAPPEAVRALLAAVKAPSSATVAAPVSPDDYGRVGDDLRRDRRVTQVVCLTA